MSRRVKPLDWTNLEAHANGYDYMIQSEQVRGEPRFHWPLVRGPEDCYRPGWFRDFVHRAAYGGWQSPSYAGFVVQAEEPDGYHGTLAQAKRWAAMHAEAVRNALD